MKVCVLSSGSKGNSSYIETKEAKILIDIGTTTTYVVNELDKIGVLFQSNVDSLVGNYGKHAMKMMKKLLKAHLVSFLA